MFSPKRILAIGAHPDDIEYGCFGFLLKKRETANIHLYVASIGSEADPTSGDNREREAVNAAKILNPSSVQIRRNFGIVPKDFSEFFKEISLMFDKVQPDLVLTHSAHDTHQEHRLVHEVTIAVARRACTSVLSYGVVSMTPEFRPNFFVDISSVLSLKKAAIRCHESQQNKIYMKDEFIDHIHCSPYALLHGFHCSEAFEVERIFLTA